MATVKYFGPTRLLAGKSGVQVEAASVKELLEKIAIDLEDVPLKILRNSLIFVNGTSIHSLKGFRTKLGEDDEIQIFSPMGGG